MESPRASTSHGLDHVPSLISIPQLSPNLENADQYSFRAVVTLVWPFSSSNRLFSLLLAEPDFRLRKQNGQIRVTFCGSCAEEVARTKIGIGDKVTLSLQGAHWAENEKIQSTPGQSLSWELQFKYRVKLEATRNNEKLAALDIDQPSSDEKGLPRVEPTTPAPPTGRTTSQEFSQDRWETPAFLRTKRILSRSPPQYDLNLFAEEDGFVPGIGRKRPRFSFPSSEWRLVDDSDDFSEKTTGNDNNWFESDEEKLDQDDAAEEKGDGYQNPVCEREPLAETVPDTTAVENVAENDIQPIESELHSQDVEKTYENASTTETPRHLGGVAAVQFSVQETHLASETPRLRPLASSRLPTPSPLVSTTPETPDYFHGILHRSPLSQRQNLNPTYTDVDHNTLSTATPDVDNIRVPGGLERFNIEALHDLDENHEYSGQNQALEVAGARNHDPISIDSTYQCGQENDNSLKIFAEMVDDTLRGQQLVHGTVTKDDQLENVQEVEEDEDEHDDEPTSHAQVERGSRKSIPSSEVEGIEPSSESEGIDAGPKDLNSVAVKTENAVNLEMTTFENLSRARQGRWEPEGGSNSSVVEDEGSSDDAREYDDEIMSEQLENEANSEPESGAEVYTEPSSPESLQQNIHPEVIIIDSDSEDEPPMQSVPSLHERDAYNDTDISSFVEEEAHKYAEPMEEDWNEYSEVEEEEEEEGGEGEGEEGKNRDELEANEAEIEDVLQSTTDSYENESLSHNQGPGHDTYVSDVESLSSPHYAEAERHVEIEAHTSDGAESFIEQNDLENRDRSSEIGRTNDNMGLGMTGKQLRPDTISEAPRFDKEPMTLEQTRKGNLLEFKEVTHDDDDDDDINIEEDRLDDSEAQRRRHEQDMSSICPEQQLVYRAASPKRAPTPPSLLYDETGDNYPDNSVHSSNDQVPPQTSSETVQSGGIIDKRHRRWTDGSDEEPLHESDRQSPIDKDHGSQNQDDSVSEKLDEVVLVDDRSVLPQVVVECPPTNFEEPDQQDRSTDSGLLKLDTKVYPTLATLMGWLQKKVDIFSVAVDVLFVEHTSSISDKYQMRLRVTDISMAGTTIAVDIVRSDETSLPAILEGDVILLHNFEVQTLDGSVILLGSDDSGWAISSSQGSQPRITHSMSTLSDPEHEYMKTLQNWYRKDGAALAADHMLQFSISQEDKQLSPFSVASSDAGSLDSSRSGPASRPRPRRRKSHRRVTIHELRDGRRYTEFGSVDSDSIHELRDGTLYAHPFTRDD